MKIIQIQRNCTTLRWMDADANDMISSIQFRLETIESTINLYTAALI
jgi:hypothetical protein